MDNQLLSSRHPVVLGRGTTHAGRMNGEALPTGAGLDKPIKGHIQHKEAVALGAVPMITLSWERHFNHPTINFFRSFLLGFQVRASPQARHPFPLPAVSPLLAHPSRRSLSRSLQTSSRASTARFLPCLSFLRPEKGLLARPRSSTLSSLPESPQEMDIVVEEELIDAIVSLIRRIPWDDLKQPKHVVAHGTSARAPRRRDAASKKKRDDGPTPAEELQSLVERMARTGVEPTPDAFAYSRYYFEALAILPIYVSITVLPYAAGRGQNAGLDYLANPNLGQAMRFFRTLGINLLDVNHVPVQIRMLHFSNALVDRRELMRDIAQHYRNQAIHEIYKILGVVDILAPVNFVANMSYGVVSTASSLLLASREGNVRDIALALAGGTGSLMKTSVYGMFATAGQMMGGFAKGFSKLALDDQFMLRSRRRPTGILSGLSLGAQDLVSGEWKGSVLGWWVGGLGVG